MNAKPFVESGRVLGRLEEEFAGGLPAPGQLAEESQEDEEIVQSLVERSGLVRGDSDHHLVADADAGDAAHPALRAVMGLQHPKTGLHGDIGLAREVHQRGVLTDLERALGFPDEPLEDLVTGLAVDRPEHGPVVEDDVGVAGDES